MKKFLNIDISPKERIAYTLNVECKILKQPQNDK